VLFCGRGPPEGAAEAAPSPAPETEPKKEDAALAIAPAPAERAAPPAATIPLAYAVAAAPTAAPALQGTKKLKNKKTMIQIRRNVTLMKNYLRKGGNRFLQDGDDTPNHDGDADDTGDAPQRREGGHDGAGKPGPGGLRELNSSSILNLKTKKSQFKFIININLISLKKGRVYHATKYMASPNILLHDPALQCLF
jgi:hypothetical protein